MKTLPVPINIEKHLSQDAMVFVNTPKNIFKNSVRLTPYEYFELANFTLTKAEAIMNQVRDGNVTVSHLEIQIIDFAKGFSLNEMMGWSMKDINKTCSFSRISMPQAVVIVKLLQSQAIDFTLQSVLEKLFQELINYWFPVEFFTQKSIKIE